MYNKAVQLNKGGDSNATIDALKELVLKFPQTRHGEKGMALGFVMTIFQKIAASSFAAVHRTLRRRMIALTVQEGLMHDSKLDIDARDAAFAEARQVIMREFHLPNDRLGQIESERIIADLKRQIVKRMNDDELAMLSSEFSSEMETTASENSAVVAVVECS